MSTKVPLALVMWITASVAQASELRGMVGGWQFELTGTAQDAFDTYDFQRDLGVEARRPVTLQLEWDTPSGWWPDLALTYTTFKADGRKFFPGTFPLTEDRTISADADTQDLDLTARYPLQWGAARASFGLSLKRLTGDILIEDSAQAQPSRQDYDEILPQLHARVAWPFLEKLAFNATLQGIQAQDNKAVEYHATLELRWFEPFRVEAGWQERRYKLDTSDFRLDATLRGPLVRVGGYFSP